MNTKRMRPSRSLRSPNLRASSPLFSILQELEGLQISRLNPDSNQISVDHSDLL